MCFRAATHWAMSADILVELSGKLLAGSVDATLHRADCTAEFIRLHRRKSDPLSPHIPVPLDRARAAGCTPVPISLARIVHSWDGNSTPDPDTHFLLPGASRLAMRNLVQNVLRMMVNSQDFIRVPGSNCPRLASAFVRSFLDQVIGINRIPVEGPGESAKSRNEANHLILQIR